MRRLGYSVALIALVLLSLCGWWLIVDRLQLPAWLDYAAENTGLVVVLMLVVVVSKGMPPPRS